MNRDQLTLAMAAVWNDALPHSELMARVLDAVEPHIRAQALREAADRAFVYARVHLGVAKVIAESILAMADRAERG